MRRNTTIFHDFHDFQRYGRAVKRLMSNMDSHGIPDNKKQIESFCREFERRRAEATPAEKSPDSTTPAPVMAAPTSSDEKEEEADTDTAAMGRGHRLKKIPRRFDEEEDDEDFAEEGDGNIGAGGRE